MAQKSINRKQSKRLGRFIPPLLLIFALLPAGCAPAEKTLPLPQASLSEEETEESQPVPDFTVKKIYTYTYETRSELGKSAFLQGAGENEISIVSQPEEDADTKLEYRQVDYRYGFYDTIDDFLWTWEEWNNPEGGELQEDLYIDELVPSPDGRQLLVYLRSAFWSRLTVWLYTLGEENPRLLYDGAEAADGPLIGSFSPSGRWVTFDAGGVTTGPDRLVPVYDCEKDAAAEMSDSWVIPSSSARLCPPDQMLSTGGQPHLLWDAALYDRGDMPILLLILRETEDERNVSAVIVSLPEQEIVPDASFLPEQEVVPDASFLSGGAPTGYMYQSCYLPGYVEMPYPQYSLSADGNELTYLGAPFELWHMNLETFQSPEKPIQFPDLVWDFRQLDSGDTLAALVQESGANAATASSLPCLSASILNPFGIQLAAQHLVWKGGLPNSQSFIPTGLNSEKGSHETTYMESEYLGNRNLPAVLQELWNIRSADLYLYPKGGTEGQLLYKNLRNLVSMEYDAANGRILLETYEGESLTLRRCIILEL